MKTFTHFFFLMLLCLCGGKVFSQVKIGDNTTSVNPNSLLELESNTKGLLLPRLTNNQIQAMTNVPTGMLLFSITDSALYLRKDTGWAILGFKTAPAASPWASNGNDIYNTNPGKVGVGTSAPSEKFTVKTNGRGINQESADGTAKVGFYTGNNSAYVQTHSNTPLFFATNDGTATLALATNGNFGIGTTQPAARLQVADSSVLFTANGDAPATAPNLPEQGAGRRMLWYPGKGAFRAGRVSGTAWDKDSIGQYSIALGNDVKAKGFSSFAAGGGASASGNFSAALGSGKATGDVSTASGTGMASGTSSTAMGSGANASGVSATAIGNNTTASGAASTAMGNATNASGTYATSIGFGTTAPSFAEVAVGSYNTDYTGYDYAGWKATDRLFSIGNGTSPTSTSNAVTVLKNGRVGIGTAAPYSQLANTSANTIGSDGNGGNPGSFAWAAVQDGYAGQIFNGSTSGAADGLAVKVASTTATALDVSQGTQTARGTSLFTVKGNGDVSYGGTLNMGVQYIPSYQTIGSLDYKTYTVGCPTGTKLIGGGGGYNGDNNKHAADIVVNYSGPYSWDNTNTWKLMLYNSGFTSYPVVLFAICAKVQ